MISFLELLLDIKIKVLEFQIKIDFCKRTLIHSGRKIIKALEHFLIVRD